MKIKRLLAVILGIILLCVFSACDNLPNEVSPSSAVSQQAVEAAAPSSAAPAVSEVITEPADAPSPSVRVFAAGDNLIHSSIYNQAKNRSADGGYDFDYAYAHVADLVAPADLAILNQETPIANDLFEPSTYPLFNSPTALGDKMIDMGFNAISHSNNHILDKGEKGLLATLDYWGSRGVLMYGAYRDEDSLNILPTMEINGITFSFVGFMEHTNGLHLPKDAAARLVYTSDRETMQRLIQQADAVSDAVIVSVHWGTEISNTITSQQKELARLFVDWGADLIIGTQPHTVQSMEYLDKPNGGRAFVAYSLGNFISAQERNLALIGVTVDLNITKDPAAGTIAVEDVKAIPVITHYGANFANVTVYPYSQYSEALAKAHGARAKGEFSMAYINRILKENIPEEFLRLE